MPSRCARFRGVDIDGTDARSNKTGNRTISLRGLPAEYTLTLIDGRRQNLPGPVAPNAFNDSGVVFFPSLAMIERIEVIWVPMSTLYGADALGGVVNIITRRGEEEWRGEATLNGTIQGNRDFGGSQGLEAYTGGPLIEDRLSLQFQGRFFDRAASSVEFPGPGPKHRSAADDGAGSGEEHGRHRGSPPRLHALRAPRVPCRVR